MHRVIERATMSAISVVNLAAQRHLAPLHPDQSLHHRQRRIPLSPVVDGSIGLSVLSSAFLTSPTVSRLIAGSSSTIFV